MSNKLAKAQNLPPKPTLDDFNKVEVKLTDIENQYILDNERRKNMAVQNTVVMFSEIMQHFIGMTARKKNIQFDEKLFAGVFYDQVKGKAYILQHKKAPEKPQA